MPASLLWLVCLGLSIVMMAAPIWHALNKAPETATSSTPSPDLSHKRDDMSDLDIFARTVAEHLLSSNYLTYEDYTKALLSGELAPSVVHQFKSNGLLPRSDKEMKWVLGKLKADKLTTAVRIDKLNRGEPDSNGMVPIEMKGDVAISSKSQPKVLHQPFKLRLVIGINSKTNEPIVAGVKEN